MEGNEKVVYMPEDRCPNDGQDDEWLDEVEQAEDSEETDYDLSG